MDGELQATALVRTLSCNHTNEVAELLEAFKGATELQKKLRGRSQRSGRGHCKNHSSFDQRYWLKVSATHDKGPAGPVWLE